jgi:hypothetical protein
MKGCQSECVLVSSIQEVADFFSDLKALIFYESSLIAMAEIDHLL